MSVPSPLNAEADILFELLKASCVFIKPVELSTTSMFEGRPMPSVLNFNPHSVSITEVRPV